MPEGNVHPIDLILEGLNVRRVGLQDKPADTNTPLEVVAMNAALMPDGVPTLLSLDLQMRFVDDGVVFACGPGMAPDLRQLVQRALIDPYPRPQPYYAIGMERCRCSPSTGGPRWNPLSVVLLYGPALGLAEVRTVLGQRWLRAISLSPEEFCIVGMRVMTRLGLV